MKLLLTVILLLPLTLIGQAPVSYQQTLEKFKKFYNQGQVDSLNAMYGAEWDEMKSNQPLWTKARIDDYLKEFGKLKSFRFVGIDKDDPNKVYVFQTVFSNKRNNVTSLTLDPQNKLSTFRFSTESTEITRLLKNFQKSQ